VCVCVCVPHKKIVVFMFSQT